MNSASKIPAIVSTFGLSVAGFAAAVLAADAPREVGAPEIDGPAGIAAIALLVSAGIVAYRRFSK